MQLKWELRETGKKFNGDATSLVAVLVETRPDDGPVEHASVSELGSIETRFLTVNIPTTREFHRGLFWATVDRRLKQLHLSPDEKDGIESTIAEKIPRPGEDWALWGVTCIPRFDT